MKGIDMKLPLPQRKLRNERIPPDIWNALTKEQEIIRSTRGEVEGVSVHVNGNRVSFLFDCPRETAGWFMIVQKINGRILTTIDLCHEDDLRFIERIIGAHEAFLHL